MRQEWISISRADLSRSVHKDHREAQLREISGEVSDLERMQKKNHGFSDVESRIFQERLQVLRNRAEALLGAQMNLKGVYCDTHPRNNQQI